MLGFIKKLFGVRSNEDVERSDFELTFSNLKELGESVWPEAGVVYLLLEKLSETSSEEEVNLLITELRKLRYGSNTNSVFHFYFPIVSHILFFKPAYEKDILHYLIGPNFANGDTETKEIISVIQGAMNYKLSENPQNLSKESQSWVNNTLPNMEKEVQREVDICWKELEE